VRGRQARAYGRAVGISRGEEVSAGGERGEIRCAPVAPRAALAERRDRTEHDAGIARTLRVVADAALGENAGRASLEHRVGALAQIEKQLAAARLLEVEGDAALAGVLCQPSQRALGIGDAVPEGPAPAQRMAAGRLDLDYVRTEITEQSAGQQPRLVREVEDAEAMEVSGDHRGRGYLQ